MSKRAMTSRRRPLSACAASTLSILDCIYTRSLKLKLPIVGSSIRRLAKLGSMVSPLLYLMQCICLVILSFVDNRILSMERFLETYLPPSSYVFNRLDTLVDKVEHLPRKLEYALDQFPGLVYKIPFLDWAVVYTIKWLEFVTSALVVWGLDHGAKEKEIGVDTNCNSVTKDVNGSPSTPREVNEVDDDDYASVHDVVPVMPIMKCSYKEALEKGVNLDSAKHNPTGFGRLTYKEEDEDIELIEVDVGEEPAELLDLFDFGWQIPKRSETTLAHSASCT